MTGIPVSPWMIPTQRPVQKSEVKDINKAWATTKLTGMELSLTNGDGNWCNKHPNFSGTCEEYVAFCTNVPTAPNLHSDPTQKLAWTDCYSYITYLAEVPSHFTGTAAEWAAKTEQEQEDWKKAPENNLPDNYPCKNLTDWRNYLLFIEDWNADTSNNTQYDASTASLWHNWNILSNATRKSLVESYNSYLDEWSKYNATGGVNKPKCSKKIDDVDSYIKCLLSPSVYPCQDCQSWHYFEQYFSDSGVYFEMWGQATTSDKQKAYRDYRAFQLAHTTDGQAVCNTCVSLLDANLLNSAFPCKDCSSIYEYLNWTDTTYGNSTNWLTYSSLSDSDKRRCFYSYNIWRKTQTGKACDTCQELPTTLVSV